MAIEAKAIIGAKDQFENIQVNFPIDNQILETSCKIDENVTEIFFRYTISRFQFLFAEGGVHLTTKYDIELITNNVEIQKINFKKPVFLKKLHPGHLIFDEPIPISNWKNIINLPNKSSC